MKEHLDHYDLAIEEKWQRKWAIDGLYHAKVDEQRSKFYFLTMLPYPSGDLHIGHWYAMAPSDARARYLRMRGFNVMFPIGFDAFGLPAENAAIKHGIHPKTWTYANIDRMRKQLQSMGAIWDWDREIVSCDPSYYKWTQWLFLQLFKHGLAYKKLSPVDWCPSCNTTLAREQVWGQDRHCERCGTPVTKRNLEQWYFKITRYAEELLDFATVDWPERVKTLQRNWIGRSDGALITFTSEQNEQLEVFTTRPDTLWGATFLVLAPEHPLVGRLTSPDRRATVDAFVAEATRRTDIEREAAGRTRKGVFSGGYAVNPATGERIQVWVADYVLMTYGTGAIMAVPAHDQRDFEFAVEFGLPVRLVVQPPGRELTAQQITEAWPNEGTIINSGPLNGVAVGRGPGQSIDAAIDWITANGVGGRAVSYKLHDWLISRQRYWGAPIPIVYCEAHGPLAVDDDQLPVLLPDDVDWMPTGESPLRLHPTWQKTTCPICKGPATRDTDTMDTFMCSSWYQYRYLSPRYDEGPWSPEESAYWMPIDCYTGGIEHATMHLIYTRFFTKALRDIGLVPYDEPMLQLRNQGVILGEDSEKMSKSRGNVVAPDQLVLNYGADVVRAYLMFSFRWDQGGPWSSSGIEGVARWVRRLWVLLNTPLHRPLPPVANDSPETKALRRVVHKTIKRVTDDFDRFEFNTIISTLMNMTNTMYEQRISVHGTAAWDEATTVLIKLVAPITPHLAEELWARRGLSYSIHEQPWPSYDPDAAADELVSIVVQVDGRFRDRILVEPDATSQEVALQASVSTAVKRHLEGHQPAEIIYIPQRLINFVLSPRNTRSVRSLDSPSSVSKEDE